MIAKASRVLAVMTQSMELLLRGPRLDGDVGGLVDRISEAHLIGGTEPFYVSPEIADLISTGAQSVPPWALRAEDLVTPHGFMYFPRAPFRVRDGLMELGAISWSLLRDIVVFMSWARLPNDDRHGPNVFLRWDLGETVDAALAKQVDAQSFGHYATMAQDGSKSIKLFASAIAFIRQRVLVTTRQRADNRSAARFADAGGKVREVAIVLLRRAGPPRVPGDEQGEPVAWSCRWWVAGHWRQQPCGEDRAERRPTWIPPHIKGPEDKPIKTTPRLFAVIR